MNTLPLSTRRLNFGLEPETRLRPSAVLFEADGREAGCVHCAHDQSWHFKALDGCVGIGGSGCACPGWIEKSFEAEIDAALEAAFTPEVVAIERAAEIVFDESSEVGVRFKVGI